MTRTTHPAAPPDLRTLSRSTAATASVPRPPRRWLARLGIPLFVLLAIASLVLYTARSLLWPSIDVWVAPVVMKQASNSINSSGGATTNAAPRQQVLVQAPGWIEADPYAISVPALTDGVVQDVLVLEGQRVEKDQDVATLIDADKKLALARSAAELEATKSELNAAKSSYDAAVTRADEVRDEVNRKRELVKVGGISEGQFARLELRLRSMEQEVAAAQAAVRTAQARTRQHEVACDEAELALARTKVLAPAAGVVLARLAEPGARISMEGPMASTLLRLYDPSKLQVRVDIPISEAAKVGVGTDAQIVTEALPDTIFKGKITRLVHEANIQRNTVQVKVAIDNPAETLKPEMLTRVRFYGTSTSPSIHAATTNTDQPDTFIIPTAALHHASAGVAHVFIVNQPSDSGPTASMRQVSFEPSNLEGHAQVQGPIREGDRVILEPLDQITDGARIKVLGEKPSTGATHAAH